MVGPAVRLQRRRTLCNVQGRGHGRAATLRYAHRVRRDWRWVCITGELRAASTAGSACAQPRRSVCAGFMRGSGGCAAPQSCVRRPRPGRRVRSRSRLSAQGLRGAAVGVRRRGLVSGVHGRVGVCAAAPELCAQSSHGAAVRVWCPGLVSGVVPVSNVVMRVAASDPCSEGIRTGSRQHAVVLRHSSAL